MWTSSAPYSGGPQKIGDWSGAPTAHLILTISHPTVFGWKVGTFCMLFTSMVPVWGKKVKTEGVIVLTVIKRY